jgi:hypothetical protein
VEILKEKTFFGEMGLLYENCLTTCMFIEKEKYLYHLHHYLFMKLDAYIAEENCELVKSNIWAVAQELSDNPALSEKLHKILSAKLAEKLKNFGKTPDTQHSTRKICLIDDRLLELSYLRNILCHQILSLIYSNSPIF